MAKFEIIMPKLGESITEATITKWLKKVGDSVAEDESIVEIATDKVDSEIPSPVEGTIKEILFQEGDVVAVDKVIAIIDMGGEAGGSDIAEEKPHAPEASPAATPKATHEQPSAETTIQIVEDERFYSPLVRSIAKEEGIGAEELSRIAGTGKDNRITKEDMLLYVKTRSEKPAVTASTETTAQPQRASEPVARPEPSAAPKAHAVGEAKAEAGDQIIEMSRMRKLIADHMVMSENTSVHVTSVIEVDVTNLVNWRERNKTAFEKREGEKLTYTPIFIHAIAKALKDFPMVNASVDGDKIILRKNINIGMATALPDGNLIVPVIKNADHKSLLGLAKNVNDLANRARNNKLQPDEIQGGTFTLTNLGTFDTIIATPVINQPQVAILGSGAIKKRPVVVETPMGDTIAIRSMMYLSMSYDHRIVDGALGGMMLKRIGEYLQNWDIQTSV